MSVDERSGIEAYAVTPFTNIKNNCATVLNVSIDAVQTSIQVVAGSGAIFPATPFYCSCEYEVMICNGRSVDTLTVARGQDGTTAAAHVAGTIIEQRNNAALWTDLASSINKIENGTTPVPLNAPVGSITNDRLATDVYRPNLLQNSGFEVWQITSSLTIPSSGTIFADPWQGTVATSNTLTVTRDAINAELGYCCAMVAAAGVSVANFVAVANTCLNTSIYAQLKGKTVTISARVKCSVASCVRLRANDSGTTGLQFSAYHPGDGVYRTLSLNYLVSANATAFQINVEMDAPGTAYVDSASVVIGTIAADWQPTPVPDYVPNVRLASDVARANLLTNGGFEIWQRGNGPFTVGGYSADKWFMGIGTGGSMSVSASQGNADLYSLNALSVAYTHGSAPSTIQQDLKGAELYQFRRIVAFSMRVKANSSNAIRIALYDSVNLWRYSGYHSGGNNYETLTVVADISGSSTQLSVAAFLSANCTAYLDNAMLVIGSVPADYVPIHPADDLARCLRYYETMGDKGATVPTIRGIATAGGQNMGANLVYKARKAVTPTATKNGTWSASNAGQPIIAAVDVDMIELYATSTAAGPFQSWSGGAGQTIIIEANP